MKINTFKQFSLNESNNTSISIWEKYGENLPTIFKKTIYKLPTQAQLEEFEAFQLESEDIVNGFGYTIIGRGMKSEANSRMIISSISMLCDKYPDNKEYKIALNQAKMKYGKKIS